MTTPHPLDALHQALDNLPTWLLVATLHNPDALRELTSQLMSQGAAPAQPKRYFEPTSSEWIAPMVHKAARERLAEEAKKAVASALKRVVSAKAA